MWATMQSMRRYLPALALMLVAHACLGQVQSRQDVSFMIPEGWSYTPGPKFDTVSLTNGSASWVLFVHSPTPCSGDPNNDVAEAWRGIMILTGLAHDFPSRPYLRESHLIGYPGYSAAGFADHVKLYARVYVLEAGNQCIEVDAESGDAWKLYDINHVVYMFLSSIRLAPLKAAPIKTQLELRDLVGEWSSNLSSAVPYVNTYTGNFAFADITGAGETVELLADGHFRRHGSLMKNGQSEKWEDSGTVELNEDVMSLRGKRYLSNYRLIYSQEALDGTTVLTVTEAAEKVTSGTDGSRWFRAAGGVKR